MKRSGARGKKGNNCSAAGGVLCPSPGCLPRCGREQQGTGVIKVVLEIVRLFTRVMSGEENYVETKWVGGGKAQVNLCSLYLRLIRVN